MIGVYKIFRKDLVLCIYLYIKYSNTVKQWYYGFSKKHSLMNEKFNSTASIWNMNVL